MVGREQYQRFGVARPESNWEFVEGTEDQSNGKEAFQPQVPWDLRKRGVVPQWNPSGNVQKTCTNYKNCLTTVMKNKGFAIGYWETVDMECFVKMKANIIC